MRITTQSLRGLAANVKISPAPHTLAESTAILQKLSSFGQVNAFKILNSTHGTDAKVAKSSSNQTYKVLYSSSSDLSRAIAASPISIDVNHDVLDPKSYDSYDVLGLHSRQRPTPITFACELTEDEDTLSHINLAKQTPFRSGFESEREGTLYRALLETRTPPGIARGISVLPSDFRNGSSFEHKAQAPNPPELDQLKLRQDKLDPINGEHMVQHGKKSLKIHKPANIASSPDLMKMYRDGISRDQLQKHNIPKHNIPKRLVPVASHQS